MLYKRLHFHGHTTFQDLIIHSGSERVSLNKKFPGNNQWPIHKKRTKIKKANIIDLIFKEEAERFPETL